MQLSEDRVSEKEFAEWVGWTRLDPRLCEIMIRFIAKKYICLNTFSIKNQMSEESKAVFAVLCDVAGDLVSDDFDWKAWKKAAQSSVTTVPFQSFYVGHSVIQPSRLLLEIKKNLNYFKRWGFYCAQSPISLKYQKKNKTLISSEQRKQILRDLISVKSEITVTDYIEALDQKVHIRQAERDLSESDILNKTGFTRNRIYKAKR